MLTKPQQQNLWGGGVALLLGLLFWPWGWQPPNTNPASKMQITKEVRTMALPSTISVTGAGTSSANGTYTPATGADATVGGVTQYTNGTDYLYYASGYWQITPLPAGAQSTALYYNAGTADTIPAVLTPYNGSPPSASTMSGGTAPTTTAPRRRPVMSG